MLNEYVEHSASSPPNLQSLQATNYEGFESGSAPLEEEAPTSASAPIFDLGRVQYTIAADLVSLVVCSDVLVMGLTTNQVIIIVLARADNVQCIDLPRKPQEMTLYKVFMDPSGRHIIISSLQGENWYIFLPSKKPAPKLLKSFKMVIESIAWNKSALLSSGRPTSTREILIGTRNGVIYEALLDAEEDFFKSQERYLQPVFTLPERQAVTGLKVDFFPPHDQTRCLIVATTPSRIYQFVGSPDRRSDDGGRVFSGIFAAYKDAAPKILELPGEMQHSDLQFFTPNADQSASLPQSLAWMTAPGIYHGKLNFESRSDDFVDGADVLPYPSSDFSDGWPLSLAVTEFHFIVLYRRRITAICHLDNRLAYEETLPLKPGEEVRGLVADPIRKTYWVYTTQSLYELLVGNEDRDVWSIYLHKAQFDQALLHAKTAGQRNHIVSAQAGAYFAEGRYFQAAQCYSQCSVTFEEVVLKFMDVGERDALRSYLVSRLERTRRTDLTQRMMLATWLVEFYLSKCNELDDIVASEAISHDVEDFRAEQRIVEEDLKQFFATYSANLDKTTTYQLIQSHGRTDMYLHYATIVGDHDRVVEHWISGEEWTKAVDVINRQPNIDLYYRFGGVLIRNAPKETVDSWLKQPSLDPLRLVPALLQLQHAPRDPITPNHAIRYLNHVIFQQGSTSPTIHNLLVTFYVAPSKASTSAPVDDGPLLKFLAAAPSDPLTGRPYYDLDYALRLCKQARRVQPCVHLYSKLGLWENSVDLALENGDVELAKINADMPEDDLPLRKKLWLKIAQYVVEKKNDIKTAMQFLESTDILKIEDILPFFPDFVVIDDFKEEIAQALEGYSEHIDTLKNEMDEATKTAEEIKKDISALRNRFVTIDAGEQCSECSHLLLTRQFYVFPCRHTFHADCLIAMAKEFMPAHTLRRMLTLQTELVNGTQPLSISRITAPRQAQRTLLSSNFNPLQGGARAAGALGRGVISAGDRLRDLILPDTLAAVISAPAWMPSIGMGIGAGRRGGLDETLKAEKLRLELEELLAASCPLCESVVMGLDKPFVKEGEIDNTWTI